ncbi:hypothetical protein KY290_004881 [Solanum tuberosum]|uniref:Malonyltransferase n=1 Tax=Solanum tuberosum TaxID=4113 RepID=A0ABQ7WEB4_SOLTU|nr:hypothetical protein KY290_004881 [Solanum tuberosum]
MASIVEQCEVAPHSCATDKLTLPLTYFDMVWLNNQRVPRILFYKLPIDKNSFIQKTIPTLKHSLSLTLKHYLPLAGNFVCPLNSTDHPELRYVKGDSVSVTFSETDMDFDYLVSNDHPRNAKDIYHFVPHLTEPKDVLGVQFAPVLAIQVTLFPNHGISICFINHHIVGDGCTIVGFIKSWALLNKYGGNDEFMMIPFYDRSIVKEPYGLKGLLWDEMKEHKSTADHVILTPPDNIVRGTFIITRNEIEKLKNLISSRRPSLTHVTSYTVTCGYVWACLIKSEDTDTDHIIIDDNVMEYFSCTVDYRARFDPPLPSSYFGNCVVWYIVKTRHVDLVGNEGFIIAAESIGETIHKRNKDKEYVLSGEWLNEDDHRFKSLSVAGSPKFDLYATDFGWGRPEKWEFVSLQTGILMSLIKSKDSNGDLEIGLSLPKTRMNAFAAIFTHGLEEFKI